MATCPVLPMDPIAATGDRMYTDADPPQGLISRIQRKLVEEGVLDEQGQPPQVTGIYDRKTLFLLRLWASADVARWPSPEWREAALAWVTDCNVYRVLGISCDGIHLVPGVTPNESRVRAFMERGKVGLDCPPPTPPSLPEQPVSAGKALGVLAGAMVVLGGLAYLRQR